MKAVQYTLFLFICLLLLRTPADAQPGAFNPSLLECGRHDKVEIICGTILHISREYLPYAELLL